MQPSYEEACAELDRLKRRLDRERAARHEAESIAEKGLRDLYQKQQQLELLEKIATASNQTTSIHEILQFATTEICEFTHWEVGHSYLAVGPAQAMRLQSTEIWFASDIVQTKEFRRITEKMEFPSGIGLPGRALATGKAIWINDVIANADNFPRHAFAANCGLRSACAFPVLSGHEVVAVLEFFSTTAREPDETILYLMSQIGLQLGRVLERKQAADRLLERAEELVRANDEAKVADKAKSAFLANMSHELRTPLNAIIGFSSMIRDTYFGPIDAQYLDYASAIHDSGVHLRDIVNDILDMSKIEVGRLELREQAFSISEAVNMCGRLLTAAATTAGVRMSFDLPASLPRIFADELRIRQILLNLMSNAIKFTPAGGIVGVSASIEEDGLVIVVNDTGIGMKAEDIVVALEPFRQVDGELNRRYDGTGLGLPLAKALVELHGGRLDIQSELGAGTNIRVRLPPGRAIGADSQQRA